MLRGTKLVAFVALVSALAAVVAPAGSPATGRVHGVKVAHRSLSALESGVLSQLNAIRAQNGLVPLKLSVALTASASQHTREMGVDGYFEHSSADGTIFWKRIDKWYSDASYSYWTVGENLLWSSPDVDPTTAMNLWMASPEHKANILNGSYREIGISAIHFAAAPGTYGGQPVTIITTDFGARR